MASRSKPETQTPTLGWVIRRRRADQGMTIAQLAERSGLSVGQIHKLENDKVQKVNPAHLALLAEPLDIPVYRLWAVAGFRTPQELSDLTEDFEEKLAQLPRAALERLGLYVDRLRAEQGITAEALAVVGEEAEPTA